MSKRGQIPQIRGRPKAIRETLVFNPGNSHARSALGDGGAYRDRTDDLKLAKLALSQLS